MGYLGVVLVTRHLGDTKQMSLFTFRSLSLLDVGVQYATQIFFFLVVKASLA